MNIRLALDPQEEARLIAAANAQGASPDSLVQGAVQQLLAATPEPARKPTRSLRGLLAKYGLAPSAEEIDQNRAEMLANFPRSDL